jgi:hypothetical protein
VVLVQAQISSPEQLGQVNFPITCRPEGQPELNRAGTPL